MSLAMPTSPLPPAKARGSSRGGSSRGGSSRGTDTSETTTATNRKRLSICPGDFEDVDSAGYPSFSCFASPENSHVKNVLKSEIPVDCRDFDSLPPAIRRKYFSSLERLRHAQQQSTTSVNAQYTHFRCPSSASSKFPKMTGMRSRSSSESYRGHSSHGNNWKHRNAADAFVLSQADAQWFLELPETVQRKHFSKEERILLANKCESVIVDAADETLYRMGRRSTNRERSLSIDSTSDMDSIRRSSIESDIQKAREEVRKSFRWMDEDTELDLSFQLNSTKEKKNEDAYTPAQPRTKKRTLSLTRPRRTGSISFAERSDNRSESRSESRTEHHRSDSRTGYSRSGATSANGNYAAPGMHRSRSSRRTLSVGPMIPSYASRPLYTADSDASYYQDPEARLKLRVYLASPQKFDEAVEFGFPSQTEPVTFLKGPPSPVVHEIFPEAIPEADVSDVSDDESFMESYHAEDGLHRTSSETETETETESEDTVPRLLSSGSTGSSQGHYPHIRPGNREMTLRMTLTRKDLRMEDDFVLEDLPIEKETGLIDWNALEKERASTKGVGFKKLWRKVMGH